MYQYTTQTLSSNSEPRILTLTVGQSAGLASLFSVELERI